MNITKNEGVFDRYARIVLSEVFALLAIFWLSGLWQVIALIAAIIMLITAMTGFCGIYRIFGISTIPQAEPKNVKVWSGVFVVGVLLVAVLGSYYSNFFTRKIFLEDYNRMNEYYKQTLFYTGQANRPLAVENYNKLTVAYAQFNAKYQTYHPYVLRHDTQFSPDLAKIANIILALKDKVNSGDLASAHTDFEQVRPLFQDIFKRNGFSMLAVSLVDFHDAMEVIIARANAKDSKGVVDVYPGVNDKLKAVEAEANDDEIKAIRARLDELLVIAMNDKTELLPAKAAELKSSFVKVYLVRG